MGWLFTTYDKLLYEKVNKKELVEKEINKEDYDILKSRMVGSTYYAAVKEKATEKVYGLVVLTSYEEYGWYFEFGTKFIDETCGPVKDDCPMSIIKLLTPTDSEWANEWRERCRKKAESKGWDKKLEYGAKVKYNNGEKEIVLVKTPPMAQFKTWFWKVEDSWEYIPKRRVTFDKVIEILEG